MMWKEFEELAGYKVSYEDYVNIIEPMYSSLINIDKKTFVKMLNKKYFSLLDYKKVLRDIKKEARHLYDICGHYTDFDSENKIEKLAKQYAKIKYNIDWVYDLNCYIYFNKGYEYEQLKRGCTYPKELVIGKNNTEYERISLLVN